MSKLLSTQEAKFVQAKLAGNNNKEAAIIAGYSLDSAKQRGYELMRRSHIQQALGITLEQLGISFEKAVKPIKDALQANKVVTSPTEPDYEVPDHSVRLKASAMALKLLEVEAKAYNPPLQQPNTLSPDQSQALNNMDEIELQRLIFKKHDS